MNRLFLCASMTLLFGSSWAGEPPKPDPKKPVDYVAWINQEFGAGITNNAAQKYQKALVALGQDRVPKPETLDAALADDWSVRDVAGLSDWVKSNERALSLFTEASRMPDCFFTIRSADGSTITAELPDISRLRALNRLMVLRARLRITEGQIDQALEDVAVVLRASRHMCAQPPSLLYLVGVSNSRLAHATLRAIPRRASGKLDYEKMLRFLDETGAVVPRPDRQLQLEKANACDVLQRFMRDRDGDGRFDLMALPRMSEQAVKPIALADALTELDKIHQTLGQLPVDDCSPVKAEAMSLKKSIIQAEKDEFVAFFAQPLLHILDAYRRAVASQRATRVIFSCYAYRARSGAWPVDLSKAMGKEPADLRRDPFSGKDFVYRIKDDAPLLYSVGPDGHDDGGRTGKKEAESSDDVY